MPKRNINGVQYHFNRHGDGEPIVLLHGFTGSSANWNSLVEHLKADHRVITVDCLGHGETEAPEDAARYRMQYAAADLAALLPEIGAAPCHLLGYSMGGRLALYMAIHYPKLIRSLILESASPGLRDPAERQTRKLSDDSLAERIERIGIPAFVAEWEKLPIFATQTEVMRKRLRPQRLQNNQLGLANSLRGMGTGVQPSLWDALSGIQIPVLLLTGALDTKFTATAEAMRALIPTAKHVVIPDSGHTIHLEQLKPYQAEIKRATG